MICDWWISIRFVCFCVSKEVGFELQNFFKSVVRLCLVDREDLCFDVLLCDKNF